MKEGPVIRGEIIEKELGQNLPKTFPTIDKFNFKEGIATSIKSLDLNAKTYQNANTLKNKLFKYVDKVAEFKGGVLKEAKIKPSEVKVKALDLAVPKSYNPAQNRILTEAAEYAKSKDVALNIIKIK